MRPGSAPIRQKTEGLQSPSLSSQSKPEDNILVFGVGSRHQKTNFGAQGQLIGPRYPDPPHSRHHTVDSNCEYHSVSLLVQVIVPEVQQTLNGRGWKDSRAEVVWCGFPIFPYILPHLELPRFCPRITTAGRTFRDTQMGTKREDRSLSREIPIPCRIIGPSIKH